MTLGVAMAVWDDKFGRVVAVAGDSRITLGSDAAMDTGIKTYELGGSAALVAAGHALPALMASELTRGLVNGHNRSTPDRRLSFFDTARLCSYFMKQSANQWGASVQALATGFTVKGSPIIARIVVSPGLNRANLLEVRPGSKVALAVGVPQGRRLLLDALERAKRDGRPFVGTALSMLHYMAKNSAPVFRSVGGGISFGCCREQDEAFSWPIVEVEGQRYLRGMQVTDHFREGWPKPEAVPYDEDWCAAADQEVASTAPTEPSYGGRLPGFDIDDISPESLFGTTHEPDFSIVHDE